MPTSNVGGAGAVSAWFAPDTLITVDGGVLYTVAAGDVDSGQVTLRLRVKVDQNGYPRTLFSNAANDVRLSVKNFTSGAGTGTGTGTGASDIVEVIPTASSYTLTVGDGGKVIEMDSTGAGLTIFIPLNADVALPVGTVIEVDNVGSGTVNFFPTMDGDGNLEPVTIQSAAGAKMLATQFAAATLRKRATDTWILIGQLT